MPFYRAFYSSRAAAEAARTAAASSIVAAYTAASQNDPDVAAGTVAPSAAPLVSLTCAAVSALPAGALPTGYAASLVTWRMQTADGKIATTRMFVPSGTAPPVGSVGSATVGDPLDWRTRITKQDDGRWAVDLYTYPPGS